ncbi:MAG: hypothetical protein AAF721_00430 [Myxococcota bacterium]
MPAPSIARTVASFPETTFGTGPTDWDVDANVVEFACIEPDISGLNRQTHDNQNYRQRPLATRQKILGLRNGEFTFGLYPTGRNVVTANAANATSFHFADMVHNAWGGRRLTRANGTQTPSATAPEVTATEGAEYEPGDIVLGINDTTGNAYFVVVDSIAADTLTLREACPEVIDTVGATVQLYPNGRAMADRDDADHVVHSFFFRGEEPTDNREANACKLVIDALDALTQGESPILRFKGMAATYSVPATQPDLAGALEGELPQTLATSTDTYCRYGDRGADYPAADNYVLSATATPGVSSEPVGAVGGVEGRVGYHLAGLDETMFEISVPWDRQWEVDKDAGTRKKLLLQVGRTRETMWGVYFPNLEIVDVVRPPGEQETMATITMRALEHDGASTQTGNALEKWRAKMHILCGA